MVEFPAPKLPSRTFCFVCRFILINLLAAPPAPGFFKDGREAMWIILTFFFFFNVYLLIYLLHCIRQDLSL